MLTHPWTYQAMLNDVMSYSLNRIYMQPPGSEPQKEQKEKETPSFFDMDEDLDEFWREHRFSQFPQVAQAVHQRISDLQQRKAELAKTIEDGADGDVYKLADTTQNLREMASSVPQYQEQKKYMDTHLALANSLLNHINERNLNLFVTVEENIANGLAQDSSELLQILRGEKGTLEDKLRLFLIYYMNKDNISHAEYSELEASLTPECPFLEATVFIRKCEMFFVFLFCLIIFYLLEFYFISAKDKEFFFSAFPETTFCPF
jgi:sec1 family domain-containing protein 1